VKYQTFVIQYYLELFYFQACEVDLQYKT